MNRMLLLILCLFAGLDSMFAQQRIVLFEEGTGTWCQYCPRGDVYAQELQKKYPGKFAFVSIHFSDPMAYAEYGDAMPFTGLPSGWVNRNAITDLLPFSSLQQDIEAQLAIAAPASVSVATDWNATTRVLKMDVTADFTQNLTGDYRLAAIVVENGVTGPAPGYNQTNAYSGGALGKMGGYETLPNPIPASIIAYNHVARYLAGGINGDAGSLPANISTGEVHSYSYTYTLPEAYDFNKVRVIGVLVNATTGEVLNAGYSNYLNGLANASPFFHSEPKTKAFLGTEYKYDIVAHDPDYDAMVISTASTLPPGMTFEDLGSGNARLGGVPTTVGTYPVELKLTDGNTEVTQSFDILVGENEGDWIQVGQHGINGFKPSVVNLEISNNNNSFLMVSNQKNSGISVYTLNADTWQKLGNDITGDAFHSCMTLDGDEPVVFSNGLVNKWDGSTWKQIGNKLPGDFYIFPDIIRAGDGSYFVVYFSPADNQTHSYKYDGTSWNFVGDVTDKYTVWNRLKLDNNGSPLLIYGIDGVNISFSQASVWDGTKWDVLGQGHIDTVRTFYDHDITMDKNGNIYAVLTYGSTNQFLNVYKLNTTANNWELTEFNLAGGAIKRCKIEADTAGGLYVAYRDEKNSGKTSVQKYDGQNWSYVGTPGFTETAHEQSLALDNNGIPYVAYADASVSDQANVKKFKKSTTSVTQPKIVEYHLVVSPNPASAEVFVRAQGAVTYQVFNLLGQCVVSGSLTPSEEIGYSLTGVNVSMLNDGIYFISVSGKQGAQSTKLVLKN